MAIYLLFTLYFVIFTLDWLYFVYSLGPRAMTWAPEVLSLVSVIIIMRVGLVKQISFHPKYAAFLLLYLIHIAFGIVYNELPIGVIIAGARVYFKFIPFFLLPAVVIITQDQFSKLFRFILLLTLIQFPVALYQRLIEHAGVMSGDRVGGTLGYHTSGVLSVYLCMAASFLIAHFLRDQLTMKQFMIFLFLFLAPTAINETKIVFFLIPLIFIIPFIFSRKDRGHIEKLFPILAALGVLVLGIQQVYDIFVQQRWGYGIFDFFTMEGRVTGYIEQTRWGPITAAWTHLTRDPIQFLLGVGIGNAHESFNPQWTGRYATTQLEELRPLSTGLSGFFWELGMGGVLLMAGLVWMLFRDAVNYASSPGFMGLFSLGMINITILFGIVFFYFFALDINIIVFSFFLMGGFLAAGEQYKEAWAND